MSWWPVAIIVFGVNFTVWGAIGLVRLLEESWKRERCAGGYELVDCAPVRR